MAHQDTSTAARINALRRGSAEYCEIFKSLSLQCLRFGFWDGTFKCIRALCAVSNHDVKTFLREFFLGKAGIYRVPHPPAAHSTASASSSSSRQAQMF